jgi:hypothetical protein
VQRCTDARLGFVGWLLSLLLAIALVVGVFVLVALLGGGPGTDLWAAGAVIHSRSQGGRSEAMGEWQSIDGGSGPTWLCKAGHRHRGSRRDGSPCTYKKQPKRSKKQRRQEKKQDQPLNVAELMGTTGAPTPPKRVRGIVSGGAPGLGKRH